MARIARVVVPYYPHHITQRGNRRQQVFFNDEDYRAYIELLTRARHKADVEILAYCFMPNHVHLVVTPHDENGLCLFFSEAHRHYTRRVNFREGWRGHLWQERFHSFVMDESYLLNTVKYVEMNPVRAKLCVYPDDWTWSSVHAHLKRQDDQLVSVQPMLNLVSDWRDYLGIQEDDKYLNQIRYHNRTGRPLGSKDFIERLEKQTGRTLRLHKPGRKAIRKN